MSIEKISSNEAVAPISTINFLPPSSSINPTFWEHLYHLKLNYYKLDSTNKPINGFLSNSTGFMLSSVLFDEKSFLETKMKTNQIQLSGSLINVNTIEEFKNIDKQLTLDNVGKLIWESIITGNAIDDPSELLKFVMLSFADLKTYKFYFWYGFPALIPLHPYQLRSTDSCATVKELSFHGISGVDFLTTIYSKLAELQQQLVYICIVDDSSFRLLSLREGWNYRHDSNAYVVILDTSNTTSSSPGWHVRNILALFSYHKVSNLMNINLICLRGSVFQSTNPAKIISNEDISKFHSCLIFSIINILL